MKCKYMRFQGREDSWITKYPKGIFSLCWNLIRDGVMTPEEEKTFRGIDDWFKEHLPEPEPCRNREKVITFFKTDTTEEMRKMLSPAAEILDAHGKPYDIVYTNAVGTVVYEDEWQAAVKVENGKMA